MLEQLSKEPRSAAHVEAGKLYHVGRAALSVAAGAASAIGTLSATGEVQMSTEASTIVWVGGLGSLVGAWVLCDAGERSYIAAARAYSAPLAPLPDEPPEAPEQDGLPPPLPGSDLK